MLWLIIKYALTAGMVVLISETAKRSDRPGGLLAVLPLVTVPVLIWMKAEGQSQQKIASHGWYTFGYVVPTLPMFLVFPGTYQLWGFWPALLICCLSTVLLFAGWAAIFHRFYIHLL